MTAVGFSIASRATDVGYFLGAAIASPVWLTRMIATGKIKTDWRARFGFGAALAKSARPRVLIHAVSVGEVNAIRGLVDRLASDRAAPEIVVSATTDTGFARAKALFAERHAVIRTPFDFSGAVGRWFGRVQPDLLVLVELELWPNMTRHAKAAGVPVVVVNGRLSDRSIVRYRRVKPLVRGMFSRATAVLAQNDVYATRFSELGAREALHEREIEAGRVQKDDVGDGPVDGRRVGRRKDELCAAHGLWQRARCRERRVLLAQHA
jgi:3-deoxy-D-manno-octulosonic-acid transferase